TVIKAHGKGFVAADLIFFQLIIVFNKDFRNDRRTKSGPGHFDRSFYGIAEKQLRWTFVPGYPFLYPQYFGNAFIATAKYQRQGACIFFFDLSSRHTYLWKSF